MKKQLILVTIALAATLHLWADVVPVTQAQALASQFLQKNSAQRARVPGRPVSSSPALKLCATGEASSYYIFNVGTDEGFVVVSGDDATEEILGYSYSGSIHPDSMPCNMRMLFDSYTDQIKFLREHGITREMNVGKKAPRKADAKPPIHWSEILQSQGREMARFGQGDPYNDECPSYWNGLIYHSNAATGCTATALAELLYFYQWPTRITNTISDYVTESKELDVNGYVAGTTINWPIIAYRYNNIDGEKPSKESKSEVAKLMKMVGVALHSDYGNSTSGGIWTVPYVLGQYFGYDESVFESRDCYWDKEQWEEMLYEELLNRGPVLYGGSTKQDVTKGSSHAFLLEGYEDGLYDINFGWDDKVIGRFKLDVVDAGFKYVYHQMALLHVKPRSYLSSVSFPKKLLTEHIDANGINVYARSSISEMFDNVLVKASFKSCAPVDGCSYEYGIGICDEGWNLLQCVPVGIIDDFPFSINKTEEMQMSFSLPFIRDGYYSLNCISREKGTTEWHLNNPNRVCLSIVFHGNMMIINSIISNLQNLDVINIQRIGHLSIKVGSSQRFTVSVLNKGDNYEGGVIAYMSYKDDNGNTVQETLKIAELHIDNGESGSFSFDLKPLSQGIFTLHVLDKGFNEIS